MPQDQCANGSAVRAGARAGSGAQPEPSPARLGELLPFGAGESGLPSDRRAHDEAAAPVAVSEAQGGVREVRALPRRGAVGELRPDTPECPAAQLRVSEGMISNESRVREIGTLGWTSGERKRGRSRVRGTGGMALDAGIRAPSTARPARLSSTLLASWER